MRHPIFYFYFIFFGKQFLLIFLGEVVSCQELRNLDIAQTFFLYITLKLMTKAEIVFTTTRRCHATLFFF